MATVPPYERLEAWRRCHQLVLEVYRTTKAFPSDERFGLTSQARRSAFSAVANIVEGSAKRGKPEFRRFLDTSLGSLSELGYIIKLACELGFLKEQDAEQLRTIHRQASKMTWALYDAYRQR